jgi:hypothetical protein
MDRNRVISGCMEPDDYGDYVTYEDHVKAVEKARDAALVEASETISGFFGTQEITNDT